MIDQPTQPERLQPAEPENTEPVRRKRGAQFGNSNAVKYGFYSKKTMRHLNYNPYRDHPEKLMEEFEQLKDALHQMFAKITPESSLADMLFMCRVLYYTTTAFNHLVRAVNQPKYLKETSVYDWDAILKNINNLKLGRPDPIFPPSPFTKQNTGE